jgi:hypothetical protein
MKLTCSYVVLRLKMMELYFSPIYLHDIKVKVTPKHVTGGTAGK